MWIIESEIYKTLRSSHIGTEFLIAATADSAVRCIRNIHIYQYIVEGIKGNTKQTNWFILLSMRKIKNGIVFMFSEFLMNPKIL